MPDRVHCYVEIPKGSRNKYEWDEELRAIKLDRFLFSSVVYPTDYGFIPDTCGQDGDPLDAMVCVSEPTFPGCMIEVKVIALFRMRDDKGIDDKVLCVPLEDPNWNHMERLDDLPQFLRDEISHFFSIYKQPEGKHVMVDGWYPKEEALTEIDAARKRWSDARAAEGELTVEIFRTPEERFDGLWGDPRYAEIDGLRIAWHEEGDSDAAPVWFMHGEPTWSYLWRKVIPPVREAGFRCIAPDMAGFGRSDKPTNLHWYTYDRHVSVMAGLLEQLDLRGATMVVHDWGGPVGLRLAVEHRDRIDRIVVLDTGLFTGRQRMSEAWDAFRTFVERTEDLPIAMLVRNATARGLSDEHAAAYDAPFPTPESKAGARAFPLMIPLTPEAPGAAAGQKVLEELQGDDRPSLCLWADKDPILSLATGQRFAELCGMPAPEVIEDASHFLQEDAGEQIGRRIAAWLTATPAATT